MQQEYNRDIDLLVQNIMFDLRPAIYNALMSRLKSILCQHNEETIKEIIDTIIKTLQINRPKDTIEITCGNCRTSHKVSTDVYNKMSFCPFCGIKMKKTFSEEIRRKYSLKDPVGHQLKDPVKIICPSCKLEVEVERDDYNKFKFLCPWCELNYKIRKIMEAKPTLEETGHESNTEATETEITD